MNKISTSLVVEKFTFELWWYREGNIELTIIVIELWKSVIVSLLEIKVL